MRNILKIRKLHKFYDQGSHALKGVDLDIKEGEFVVLLGLSGSGKSTLLRCINKLVEPTSGEIYFLDTNLVPLNESQTRPYRKKIGMIFQQFNLINNLSALQNVLSGKLGERRGLATLFWSDADKETALAYLQRVGLAEFATKKVKKLSGGQQQRVAIARALMQNPLLILADEPVASLDPATSDSIMQHLKRLNKDDGITVICSLHFLSLARQYADRVVALKDGEVVFEGGPQEITPARFKEIYGQDACEVDIR